jgi:LemA protein
VAFLAISWMVSTYNGLITKEEQTIEAWAQVENQYQRRADLIPNLIATVKGASNFEQETLDRVINARSAATSIKVDPSNMTQEALDAFTAKQGELQSALGRLMAIAEDYPVLSSMENFRDLQAQLEGTENRISVERRRFNDVVGDFNSTAKRFPNSILGFDSKAYFRSGDGASEVPEVIL